ncbi:MAG: Zn-dependent exopeptidase M28 [Kiritimatiellae bacterium]|nr:Zn-dependent exopeptidase M28 [Kiritimatiellia bacterium]
MFSLFLAAAIEFTPQDARLAFDRAKGLVAQCTPRDAGTIRGRLAANYLLDAASSTGADVRRDGFMAMTPNGEREFTNLYAEYKFADESFKWVVLVSHYDTKPGAGCPGANDGASTSGLLVGVANAIANWKTPRGNIMLIWTDGEECISSYGPNDGLWGAKRAAEYIVARQRRVQAVVCLDMLGDKDLSISVPSNGTPTLGKIAVHAARRAGYPGLVQLMAETVKDDHVPFLEKGFPAIDLIDFSYGPGNSFWHTPKDTVENISEGSLLKSGRVVAELLNILL